MAKQLGVAGDMAYTCETAAHFWLLHVLSRWEKFLADCRSAAHPDCVQDSSPSRCSHPLPCYRHSAAVAGPADLMALQR